MSGAAPAARGGQHVARSTRRCTARDQQLTARRRAPNPVPRPAAPPQKEDGRDPLSWEDDDLQRIAELHSKDFSDKAKYLAAPNLADYLGLSAIEQVHLPLPLHLVFIGFMVRGRRSHLPEGCFRAQRQAAAACCLRPPLPLACVRTHTCNTQPYCVATIALDRRATATSVCGWTRAR